MCEARDGSSAITEQYFGLGEKQGGSAYCYEMSTDGPCGMVNSSGTEVSSIAYGPWGEPTVLSGSVLPTKQYRGMYAHAPSKLNLTWFRQYDPSSARWLSRDPIGERGGTNLFNYAANNPISNSDPDGRVVVTGFNMPTTGPLSFNLFTGSSLPGINSMFGPLFRGSSCGGGSSPTTSTQVEPTDSGTSATSSTANWSMRSILQNNAGGGQPLVKCIACCGRGYSTCLKRWTPIIGSVLAERYCGQLAIQCMKGCAKDPESCKDR